MDMNVLVYRRLSNPHDIRETLDDESVGPHNSKDTEVGTTAGDDESGATTFVADAGKLGKV